MSRFYNSISAMWQRQITVAELDQAFSSVFNFTGDFKFLDHVKPVIDFATIIDDGILLLSGSFITDTTTIYFSQKYLYEGITWKLLAFEYSDQK